MEENKSLEKINQNYENNKKMLYQGIEQEKKKLIGHMIAYMLAKNLKLKMELMTSLIDSTDT